jgi:hypothetical protein
MIRKLFDVLRDNILGGTFETVKSILAAKRKMNGLTEARLDPRIFCGKFTNGRANLIGQPLNVLRSNVLGRTFERT